MATLNKIRSKAGLLVVIIGVALLAFIVGDFLNSGHTFYAMNQNKVAVVNGTNTVIHEATHAKINKPNTKSQELQCYVNEYRHQNIELTEKVLQDIINHINDKYPNLKWE